MKTRRFISLVILCFCWFAGAAIFTSAAQAPGTQNPAVVARETARSDRALAAGLDRTYDFSPKASTPAPKGYEPVFVEHYGRHGSRYAYTAKAYTVPMNLLRKALDEDNITGRGAKLLADLERFWEQGQYKVGDLTPLGWQQHERIAREMVQAYRPAFGKGSRVDACASASTRAIVSMASLCASVAREAPGAKVYAHQSVMDIQATRPNMGKNPFRYTGPEIVFPFAESPREFLQRRMPGYGEALSRLFRDPARAMRDTDVFDFFFNYYMLVAGMGSIPEEERIDMRGLLTDEEFATLWEIDNYERFREYLPYKLPCASIVDDIIAKADARLGLAAPADDSAASAGITRGADLRFGHDHVVMSLLMDMDINGFGVIPSEPDDLAGSFQTWHSPMAANIQMVFYVPKKAAKKGPVTASDVLVKVLLNGSEARFGVLSPASGPYYHWSELKDYLARRVGLVVTR